VRAARERGDRLAEAVLGFQHGFAHRQRGDLDRAVQLFTAAQEAAKRADSADAEATALESLGVAYLDQGDPRATELLRRNLDLAFELGDPRRIALARFHLAKAVSAEEALPLLEQAWAGLADEPHNAAKVELWRGKKLIEADRLEEAETTLARVSAAVHREHGEALLALADVALARGDRAAEREQVRAAAQIFQRRGLTLLAVSAESRLAALD
jgi:tetratricopeptide (TPR) repeat protein